MDIARIVDGVVANLEVASLEWIEANADPEGRTVFVPYTADNPAVIGLGWDPIGGFEQEPPEPETITVTPAELEQLVDERIVERLEADVAALERDGWLDREPG
jgi:hypothetical protein